MSASDCNSLRSTWRKCRPGDILLQKATKSLYVSDCMGPSVPLQGFAKLYCFEGLEEVSQLSPMLANSQVDRKASPLPLCSVKGSFTTAATKDAHYLFPQGHTLLESITRTSRFGALCYDTCYPFLVHCPKGFLAATELFSKRAFEEFTVDYSVQGFRAPLDFQRDLTECVCNISA